MIKYWFFRLQHQILATASLSVLGSAYAHAEEAIVVEEDGAAVIMDEAHGAAEEAHGALEGVAEHAADAAHGAAHESSAGLPQLDFTTYPSQIFWLVIFFIFLYGFFSRKTLPDISGTIESRQEHIRSDLDTADELKTESETVKEAYEAILEQSRAKSGESFAAVDEAIKEKTKASTDDFLARSAKEIEKTEKAVEKAKAAAMAEVDAVAARVAADAAVKIIGGKADVKYAESIVQSLQGKKEAA